MKPTSETIVDLEEEKEVDVLTLLKTTPATAATQMVKTTKSNRDNLIKSRVNALEGDVGTLGARFENNRIQDNLMFPHIRN
jgi:hypothetical protein